MIEAAQPTEHPDEFHCPLCFDDPANIRPQWQLIETAPQDGTVILGYRDGKIANASRVPRDDYEMWTFGALSADVRRRADAKPTHWMPLPPPPTTSHMTATPTAGRDE